MKEYKKGDEIVSENIKWGIIIEVIDQNTIIIEDEDGEVKEIKDSQVLSHWSA